MRPDGGAAPTLPYPHGDPTAVRGAAGKMRAVSHGDGQAADALGQHSRAALAAWRGPAASAFQGTSQRLGTGVHQLGAHSIAAASVLDAFADALEAAQQLADKAERMAMDAETTFTSAVQTAASRLNAAVQGATDAAVHEAHVVATRAQDAAAGAYRAASSAARQLAERAVHDAETAARLAARQLSDIANAFRDKSLHELVDLLGGPGAALEIPALVALGRGALRLPAIVNVLASGDFNKIAALNPEKWAEVERIAAKYGDTSMEALRAMLTFEQDLPKQGLAEVGRGLTSLGRIPPGAFDGTLDVLGKVAAPLAAVSDVLTIADGKASTLDRSLSGVNLAGLGMAAAGTEAGGAALALVGIDSVAAFVPVVGEVAFGVTAAVLAGEYIYQHWDEIKSFVGDVGRDIGAAAEWEAKHVVQFAEDAGHDVVVAGQAVYRAGQVVVAGAEHAAATAVHAVSATATAVVDKAEQVASTAVHVATDTATTVVHEGEHVLEDLNPLNW